MVGEVDCVVRPNRAAGEIEAEQVCRYKSRGITVLLCFDLEDCFAVAEFGANLIIAAKRIPDKKPGDKDEG
jgi:hypothetical protein